MILATERFTSPASIPTSRLVLLHGILGRGANLRTLARRFVDARPDWEAVVVDLRNHGASLGGSGPDTLAAAARDMVETFSEGLPVRALLGHSYGGKVTLACVSSMPTLAQVFVVDSELGTRRDAVGDDHPLRVLEVLERVRGPWTRREDFVAALSDASLSKPIAQWLAMNLGLAQGAYSFGPDLTRVRAMLDDYFACDFWPTVEAWPDVGPRLALVVGSRSRVWRPHDVARAQAVAARTPNRVSLSVLDSGHWVHVDAFEALLRIIVDGAAGEPVERGVEHRH